MSLREMIVYPSGKSISNLLRKSRYHGGIFVSGTSIPQYALMKTLGSSMPCSRKAQASIQCVQSIMFQVVPEGFDAT